MSAFSAVLSNKVNDSHEELIIVLATRRINLSRTKKKKIVGYAHFQQHIVTANE